jgi:hypothetical protein
VTGTRLGLALFAALVAASVWVGAGTSSVPELRVAFVSINGKGSVTSTPKGISCPKTCRGQFPKDGLVHLTAHAAPGWRVLSFAGWCKSKKPTCSFNLTTNHDCSSKLCAVGAFGVQVFFVRQS